MIWFVIAFVDSMLQNIDASIFDEEVHVESSNFHCEDLFQMTKNSVKVLTSLVAQELDAFCCYNHVDVDNCKCALSWWHGEEHKFQY
jgi:hypothetical protein